MPILANARHERFAQELAKGKTASEAYETAGFQPSRPNASRLQHADNIRQRVAEIQAADAAMAQEATQRAVETLALSREWVLARLQENALKAAESGDYGPSNKALELIGKEIAGMFVDRSESKHTITHSHEDMLDALERVSAEEIVAARH